MAGSAGRDFPRNHKGSRSEHVVFCARHRQSCAASEYHVGRGADFIDTGTSGKAAAQCEAVHCDRKRRRKAGACHELIHAAARRRQNCRRATVAASTRARGVNQEAPTMNSTRTSHVRWFLVFWLFILSAVSYLDRVNISIAGGSI